MVSTDRDILLSINGRLIHLEQEQAKQRQEFSEFKAVVLKRLDNIETDITIIKHDQANLQTSVYWVLGAVTAIFALITLPAALSSLTSLFRKSEPQHSESQSIVNSLTEAFMKGLSAGRNEKA